MTELMVTDKYAGRDSSEFPYKEVLGQVKYEDAELLSFSMKRYGNRRDPGNKIEVTTFADWSITSFEAEHCFPMQIVIDVRNADDTEIGRLEADYEICFYSHLTINREHFPQLLKDLILPYFWEMVDEFLCGAMFGMRFDHGLLEDKIYGFRQLGP